MSGPNVLVSPAGPSLDNSRYGKEYYLLKSIAESNSSANFTAYFKNINNDISHSNIQTKTPERTDTRNQYYFSSFLEAKRELQSGKFDIYHHLNFHYRFFNPLLLTGHTSDIPVILGPAQPPHTVPLPSKKRFIRQVTRINWSDSILEQFLPWMDWTQENIYNRFKMLLFARSLMKADAIVVVNDETAKIYSEFVPRSKIEVIPYGVVSDRFEKGNPEESTDLVAIGTLFYRKGFDLLIKAWAQLANQYPETSLHIYGDGPQRASFESLAEEYAVNDSVVFHGNVEHHIIRDALANARAFVHPSRSEGFPHVRLEAMASGCPVIASNVTGTNEMIRNGIDGLVIPTGNVYSLVNAIEELLMSPKMAKIMGEKAEDRVRQIYTWKSIAGKLNDVYLDVLME